MSVFLFVRYVCLSPCLSFSSCMHYMLSFSFSLFLSFSLSLSHSLFLSFSLHRFGYLHTYFKGQMLRQIIASRGIRVNAQADRVLHSNPVWTLSGLHPHRLKPTTTPFGPSSRFRQLLEEEKIRTSKTTDDSDNPLSPTSSGKSVAGGRTASKTSSPSLPLIAAEIDSD